MTATKKYKGEISNIKAVQKREGINPSLAFSKYLLLLEI